MDVSPLFYALVIALRQLGPVLLAVDDADLADRETLAVLQYVVHRLEQQQIWLLVTTRPLHPGSACDRSTGCSWNPGPASSPSRRSRPRASGDHHRVLR